MRPSKLTMSFILFYMVRTLEQTESTPLITDLRIRRQLRCEVRHLPVLVQQLVLQRGDLRVGPRLLTALVDRRRLVRKSQAQAGAVQEVGSIHSFV